VVDVDAQALMRGLAGGAFRHRHRKLSSNLQ
jgi:hypothetical protein